MVSAVVPQITRMRANMLYTTGRVADGSFVSADFKLEVRKNIVEFSDVLLNCSAATAFKSKTI